MMPVNDPSVIIKCTIFDRDEHIYELKGRSLKRIISRSAFAPITVQEPEAQDGQYPPDLGIDPLARLLGHFENQCVSSDLARYHPDIHDHAIRPTVTGHRFDIDPTRTLSHTLVIQQIEFKTYLIKLQGCIQEQFEGDGKHLHRHGECDSNCLDKFALR